MAAIRQEQQWGGGQRSGGLVDVLDRVLDKGLVIAGDIKISLAEVELLTVRIRLIICSLDKAQEVGLDWWKSDPHLSSSGKLPVLAENESLREQIEVLERKIAQLEERSIPRPKPVEGSGPSSKRPPSLTGGPARTAAPARPVAAPARPAAAPARPAVAPKPPPR